MGEPIRTRRPVKSFRQFDCNAGHTLSPHNLANPKRLRNDIEALLRTYDEVAQTWPQDGAILAKLRDGRSIVISIKFERKNHA